MDSNIPLVTKKFNKNFNKIEPWVTRGLLTSRRFKIMLEKNHFTDPSANTLDFLKRYRNLYNKLIKAAKKLYFEHEFRANQGNLKRSWELIRAAMNKKIDKSSSILNIAVNGVTIDNPTEMANLFNEFFTSVAAKIVNEINPVPHPPKENLKANIPLFSFSNIPVSVTEITNATKLLQGKKTLDMTGNSTWLIQKVIDAISVPIKHVLSASFNTGTLPQQLKIAKVIPVFKSGSKDSMDNYRPISLLNSFSKIFEKIVGDRLTSFLEENNLISNAQYGFRKKHSTLHPLVHFLNFVSNALDKKEHSIAIFCDLRKAFDTVDHCILLNKLNKMGVRGVELLWFQSYLSNRKQFVHINGSNSLLLNILIGVPQGSILGPLLFLVYINDLPLCSELISFLFADDTTLLMSDSN
jgi:hypothetical protein